MDKDNTTSNNSPNSTQQVKINDGGETKCLYKEHQNFITIMDTERLNKRMNNLTLERKGTQNKVN